MLVIGISGTELTAAEREWLQHDACAGVILFARNFASRAQVAELSQSIREAARFPQLICVDQEGGRVQRFREGYSVGAHMEQYIPLDVVVPGCPPRPQAIIAGVVKAVDVWRVRLEEGACSNS